MDELSTEQKIENLQDRVDTVVNSFEKLQIKLDQLISAIQGNEAFGTKGHSKRIADLEQEMTEREREHINSERRIDKIYYRVMGIATGVSIATVVFAWLFTNVVITNQRTIEPPDIDPKTFIQPLLPESAISAPTLQNLDLPRQKVSPAEAALDTLLLDE